MQRQNSNISIDDVKIYSTPRRLIRSLQNSSESDCNCCSSIENSNHHHHTTKTPEYEVNEDEFGYSYNMKCCAGRIDSAEDMDMMVVSDKSESVSSNDDAEVRRNEKNEDQAVNIINSSKMGRSFAALSLVFYIALIIPVIAAVLFMWNNGEEGLSGFDVVVPT